MIRCHHRALKKSAAFGLGYEGLEPKTPRPAHHPLVQRPGTGDALITTDSGKDGRSAAARERTRRDGRFPYQFPERIPMSRGVGAIYPLLAAVSGHAIPQVEGVALDALAAMGGYPQNSRTPPHIMRTTRFDASTATG